MKNFTYERFQELVQYFEEKNSMEFIIHQGDPDVFDTLLDLWLQDFSPQFRDLVFTGKIVLPDFKGHRTNFSDEFNRLLKKQPPRYGNYFDIEQRIAHSVLFSAGYSLSDSKKKEFEIKGTAVYQELKIFTETGGFPTTINPQIWSLYHSSDAECFECGAKMSLHWFGLRKRTYGSKPELVQYKHSNPRDNRFVDIDPCEATESLSTAELDFPSGKIYACDWFRIKGFTEYVDRHQNDQERFSLNNRMGCINIAKNYAKDSNFAKFQVGNSSPSVFVGKNKIWFGYDNSDSYDLEELQKTQDTPIVTAEELGFEYKGYICTDLWAACFIDEQTLLEILTVQNPQDDAQVLLNAWKQETNPVEFEVQPGKYRMMFDGYSHTFDSKYEHPDKTKALTLFGVIEKI